MTGRVHLKVCAALVVAMAAAFVAILATPAGAANDLRPDLRMAALDYYGIPYIETTSDGRRLLRFDTIIVNVGAGKFEVHGSRPATTIPEMTVTQRVFNDAGGYRDRATAARMYFAGDEHTHWHLRNLQKFTLSRLADGKIVGTGVKHGFCFWDNVQFGPSPDSFYTWPWACSYDEPNATEVPMGLSVGWGDVYSAALIDQYIDVTGLSQGRYRLRVVADPYDWFLEEHETNNFTWLVIRISGNNVDVIRHGPAAVPIG